MLSQLSINNIAVIEKSSLEFKEGFTVLTGETGAGKSIVIDSIGAVLGERTSKELVRAGAEKAIVAALFNEVEPRVMEQLEDMGFPLEPDGSLLIQREIRTNGKNICRINGMAATVTMLRELGPKLVSIHGQHDSYELLSETAHMEYIDSYGELGDLLGEYQACYNKLKAVQRQLKELITDEAEKARRMDLLSYQIEELEDAGLRPGEQEELSRERDIIRNGERIALAITESQGLLSGDEEQSGSISELKQLSAKLSSIVEFLPEISAVLERAEEASYILEDVNDSLRNLNIGFDPERLEEVEQRLDLIYRLGLKYGETEEEMLAFLADSIDELNGITKADETRESLAEEYEQLKTKAIDLAKKLSVKRKETVREFETRVKDELAFLDMPVTAFVVDTQRVPLDSHGCDKMQFLISVNRGEEPKPMTKIASGGELSRIMLAIKTVLSGKDGIPTLIFDEIDTGIGGEAAKKVGEKLRQVSKSRQVICITHLPQMAAIADHQLKISKSSTDDKTFTVIENLDSEARIMELARMLGGNSPSSTELGMARELIEKRLDN